VQLLSIDSIHCSHNLSAILSLIIRWFGLSLKFCINSSLSWPSSCFISHRLAWLVTGYAAYLICVWQKAHRFGQLLVRLLVWWVLKSSIWRLLWCPLAHFQSSAQVLDTDYQLKAPSEPGLQKGANIHWFATSSFERNGYCWRDLSDLWTVRRFG